MPNLTVDVSKPNQATFAVSNAVSGGTVYGSRLMGVCEPLQTITAWVFPTSGISGPVKLKPGPWVFWAQDTSGPSSVSQAFIADGLESVAIQCRSFVADCIRSWNIPLIRDRVYESRAPIDTNVTYPCAFVNLWNFSERDTSRGTNFRTQWEYPISVVIGDRANMLDDNLTKSILAARQLVLEGFDWNVNTNMTVQWTQVQPKQGLQRFVYPVGEQKSFYLTGSEIIVNCTVRRPRAFRID